MKKEVVIILIISIFLISGFLISGCVEEIMVETESVSCGDNICQLSEGCDCIDCKDTPRCKEVEEVVKCDDSDRCTKDIYDERSGKCVYIKLDTCCGDNVCENGERCDLETYTTGCIEDCGVTCPAKVVFKDIIKGEEKDKSFFCGEGCIKTGENKFTITKSGSVKTILENIGEKSNSLVTSTFNCGVSSYSVSRDNDKIHGISFKDYFDDNEDELKWIDGKVKENNYAIYTLEFNTDNKEKSFSAICTITLNSNEFKEIQVLEVLF